MAYNFKSIADVEVVAEPLETANVLIEEDGVIKRAPKTAVGGAGNDEWDAVIEYVNTNDDFQLNLVAGDFSVVRDKILDEQLPPKILIKSLVENYGLYYRANEPIEILYLLDRDSAPVRNRIVLIFKGFNRNMDHYINWYEDGELTE